MLAGDIVGEPELLVSSDRKARWRSRAAAERRQANRHGTGYGLRGQDGVSAYSFFFAARMAVGCLMDPLS